MALKLAMSKSWKIVVAIAGGLAVIAGIFVSLATIKEKSAQIVGPLFEKDIQVAIGLGTPADRRVTVGLNFDPASRKFAAVKNLTGGEEMSFELPANAQHRVQWQGSNFKAAAADIIVGQEASKWTLRIAGKEGDFDVLSLVEAVTQRTAENTPLSATALVAAAKTVADRDQAWASASHDPFGPAMDRAYAIVGLLEVGSPDCADTLMIRSFTIRVGCVGFLPGNLSQVLSRLDADDPALIGRIMGPRAAELRAAEHRAGLPHIPTDEDFRRRVTALTQDPHFKAAYDKLVRDLYGQAVGQARALGLYSERGVLFVLDRLVEMGPGYVRRRLRLAGSGPTNFSPATERERLRQLAGVALQSTPDSVRRFSERRINMITTGHGKLRDVDYDLNALGIRYDRPLRA